MTKVLHSILTALADRSAPARLRVEVADGPSLYQALKRSGPVPSRVARDLSESVDTSIPSDARGVDSSAFTVAGIDSQTQDAVNQ